MASTPTLRRPHWFRSSYAQAVILGLASFSCPGIWGAMANVGAGGLESATTGNAATAVTFCLMVVTALLGPPLLGKIGPRKCLIIGTLGYAPYAAGLFCNSKFGTQWGVLFGAAMCGLSAGLFWATEGSTIICYPEEARRGRAIAIWFSINQLGSVIGGSIDLALNVHLDRTGGLAVNTYAVFIAIQCLGPFVAALLSEPEQVQRTDGRKPVLNEGQLGFFGELWATVSQWAKKHTLIFAIVFFMCQWGAGTTSYYLTTYFTVRSRALSALVAALLNQSVIWIVGSFSDNTRFTVRTRATVVGTFTMVLLGYSWIHFFVNQYHFARESVPPTFDWTTPGWANAWIPVVLNSLATQLLYNWVYWVVAYVATGQDRARQIAVMRSVESCSSALTYGISAAAVPHINLAAVNLAIYGIAIYPVIWAVQYISYRDENGLNVEPEGDDVAGGDADEKVSL